MAARAIWKGNLKLGAAKVPVKLYSAVEDRTVHFHILDARTHHRVKQRMVEPESGEEVPADEIQKGLEIEPGTFVILGRQELAALQPEPSRDIEVSRFVTPERINHQWYDRPYYLGPGEDAAGDYFALAQALQSKKREGVAEWVMRGKQYHGALVPNDGYLMLITLRPAEEVVPAKELPEASGKAPDSREIKMAQQLVAALEGEFDPAQFRDEYRSRVLEYIQAKAKGRKPKLVKITEKRASTSLLSALSASLKHTKQAGGKAVA